MLLVVPPISCEIGGNDANVIQNENKKLLPERRARRSKRKRRWYDTACRALGYLTKKTECSSRVTAFSDRCCLVVFGDATYRRKPLLLHNTALL